MSPWARRVKLWPRNTRFLVNTPTVLPPRASRVQLRLARHVSLAAKSVQLPPNNSICPDTNLAASACPAELRSLRRIVMFGRHRWRRLQNCLPHSGEYRQRVTVQGSWTAPQQRWLPPAHLRVTTTSRH